MHSQVKMNANLENVGPTFSSSPLDLVWLIFLLKFNRFLSHFSDPEAFKNKKVTTNF